MHDVSTILSFDPASSKNLGWSIIYVNKKKNKDKFGFSCVNGTAVFDVDEPWRSMWPIFVAVDTILEIQKPDIVIIEKTSSFSGGFITGQVSNCIGVILACLGKHQIPIVQFVYPTHVKKIVTGDGRASKTVIKKRVKQIIGLLTGEDIKFDSEHACDATSNILCWLIENNIIKV